MYVHWQLNTKKQKNAQLKQKKTLKLAVAKTNMKLQHPGLISFYNILSCGNITALFNVKNYSDGDGLALADGEDSWRTCSPVSPQITSVTDRQTDGQTNKIASAL